MTIKIETDANGLTVILLTDEARFGAGARVLPVNNILIRGPDGHLFIKSPSSHGGLSRASEIDVEMVEYYFDKLGGPHEPDIFAGDPPPSG